MERRWDGDCGEWGGGAECACQYLCDSGECLLEGIMWRGKLMFIFREEGRDREGGRGWG